MIWLLGVLPVLRGRRWRLVLAIYRSRGLKLIVSVDGSQNAWRRSSGTVPRCWGAMICGERSLRRLRMRGNPTLQIGWPSMWSGGARQLQR